MKEIPIGLIGFGTIGTGVVKLLRQNEELITKKLGARLVIKKIADIDITTPREVRVHKGLLTRDAREIINDKDIPIIIELMGGYEPARTLFSKLLPTASMWLPPTKRFWRPTAMKYSRRLRKMRSISVLKRVSAEPFQSS